MTGSLAYGPFGQASDQYHFWPVGSTSNANLTDWHAAVGRSFGAWGLEAGYRAITWNVIPAHTSAQFRWPGWYVGLNFTMS